MYWGIDIPPTPATPVNVVAVKSAEEALAPSKEYLTNSVIFIADCNSVTVFIKACLILISIE